MKHLLRLAVIAATLGFFSCSPASKGKSAGNDYCKCNTEEGIIEIAKCKKNVMGDNKENLDNLEFQEAFWKTIGDCD